MNYETAKKLKDAGFPQNPHGYTERPGGWFDEDGDVYDWEPGSTESVYIPTLSELIEAVGTEFAIQSENGRWMAQRFGESKERVTEWGDTIEEAVASLWLELNKNA